MNPSYSEDHVDDHSETDEDSGEEVWDDLVLKDLINDIENTTHLPAKEDNKHIEQSLLFWLLYFLLIWKHHVTLVIIEWHVFSNSCRVGLNC